MSKRVIQDTAAIIVAGGSGKRMKRSLNKPYLEIAGKPILLWTVSRFQQVAEVGEIVVVYRKADQSLIAGMKKELRDAGATRFVIGGVRRQDSAARGVRACNKKLALVAIHDAARPLVRPASIRKVIRRARTTGCAMLARPVTDTTKREGKRGQVLKTVPRKGLWLAQTPQVIERKAYLAALRKANREGWEVTDDASIMERYGHRVALVKDSLENIKITQPEDLKIAEAFLSP